MKPKFCIKTYIKNGSMFWTLFEKKWYGWAKIQSYGLESRALEQLSMYTWRPGSTYYDSRGNRLESADYSQRPKFCIRWMREGGNTNCALFERRRDGWARLHNSINFDLTLDYLHYITKKSRERYYDADGNEIEQSKGNL